MEWSKLVEKFSDSSKKISGTEYPTKIGDIDHRELTFYTENPRIYTKLNPNISTPEQDEIEKLLIKQKHVKKLVTDIVQHGGNIEPIIVRDKTFEVLEGNSRLAAYRKLQGDPKFHLIKCEVLPYGITDEHILAFLGQIHITGKTAWAKHEKARYLLRMTENEYGDPIREVSEVAKPIGISVREAKKEIDTIKMLIKHNAGNDKFSYFYSLLSNREAKNALKNVPDFEQRIVEEISEENFDKALDFREALTPVCRDRRILNKFIKRDIDLVEAKRRIDLKETNTTIHASIRKASTNMSDVNLEDLDELTISQFNALKKDLRTIKNKLERIYGRWDELNKITDS